jgi:hypothetical protein
MWSDPNQTPFMALTAHWIERTITDGQQRLRLRSDLIGFHKLPGRHTGDHMHQCFLYLTDRLEITRKVILFISAWNIETELVVRLVG